MDQQMLGEYQATCVVLSDYPTEPVDAVFFHARSYGDDDGLFELAAVLLRSNMAKFVAINGSDGEKLGGTIPGEAWPGQQEYVRRLLEQGVHASRILTTGAAYHTRQDSDEFLALAGQLKWKSAVIIAQPHQLLRIMQGQVKSMQEAGYWMRVYPVFPRPCDWNKAVRGSQGLELKPRFEHIADEHSRRFNHGNLATIPELLEYLLDTRHNIR